MGRTRLRQAYHVARADFLQRARSRQLAVVLAVIASIGYLVNTGGVKLAYQVRSDGTLQAFHGEPTAAYIGLKAGITGAIVLLFGGFYLMKNALQRDRNHGVAQLVARTPISDRTYLFGKWLSNLAFGGVLILTLGVSSIANHAVHGVGPTTLTALLIPLLAFAFPVAALVSGLALFSETVDPLNGMFGNICYFLFMPVVLGSTLTPVGDMLPGQLPLWVKSLDLMGYIAIYTLTASSLLAQQPVYAGGLPSVGTLEATRAFYWNGGAWPLWVYPQRLGVVLCGLCIVLVSTVPFDRLHETDPAEDSGWLLWASVPSVRNGLSSLLSALLSRLGGKQTNCDGEQSERPAIESLSLTPVATRDAGGFHRLLVAELRLALRGRPWWWYGGAILLVGVPVVTLVTTGAANISVEPVRTFVFPIAAIWPLIVWSDIGVRPVQHRVLPLVLSSRYPLKQLIAEWLSGIIVAIGVGSGVFAVYIATGHTGALLGFVSGVLLAPSLATAAGSWSRSTTLFELSYLTLWYVGPLNGAQPVDFIGATDASVEMGIPLAFVGLSAVLVGTALLRRTLELG
ncbi:hypothetical protein C499_11166 [Halogeometricum borinquense DSM 11551]|uniref:Uncharacterized protein n=1 Tax=Halogeometricum borinquense (strain ATCC 700274 / DSM 11551 / JCM 10706 / KCTC 4070 / PR3) TaxID=469382 RepID=E4NS73_HALBP|nr:hypothetical protein [Halogeometricum borinquense]ADQ65758.1 hypothetical protein Hbor_01470 [Halogeometricum borinquense DSM 11551]ELY26762.1 hypothetical protein C499_11166 [Halogeometricum borinquense DSM 11551]